jgi:hypothetical protein
MKGQTVFIPFHIGKGGGGEQYETYISGGQKVGIRKYGDGNGGRSGVGLGIN